MSTELVDEVLERLDDLSGVVGSASPEAREAQRAIAASRSRYAECREILASLDA